MKTRYFDLAKKMARKSPSKFKLGCVIVKKNKVISVGFNDMTKTHPQSNSSFNTLHAEVDALIGLDFDITKDCDVYVFREHKDGRLALAKPCPTCMMALRKAGIRNIYHTIDDGYDCTKSE